MDLLGICRTAFGVADDPPHRVAGRNRTGADELLPLLQGDVRYLSGCGVDLVEGAIREWIDLHGVDVAVARRLHARRLIRLGDAVGRILRLRGQRPGARQGRELTRERQRLRDLDDLDRLRRLAVEEGRLGVVVVADLGRLEGGAGRERD